MVFIPKFITAIINAILEDEVSEKVEQEINFAILDGRFEFLKKADTVIGFFTYHFKDGKVLINNLCILKQYRNKNNLLFLRKYLRDKLEDFNKFYWIKRKGKKEVVWEF